MKRIQFIGIVLFLLGALVQPCVAAKKGQTNQQLAIEYVSKLSDDEVRAQLPGFRQEKEKFYHLYQKSLHSSGNLIAVDQAAYKAGYEYNSYIVAEMEKRMRVIDTKKAKEDAAQKAKEEAEKKAKSQQEADQEEADRDRQRQGDFDKAYQKHLNESNQQYMHGHNVVNTGQAIKEQNLASDGLHAQAYMPGSKPISSNMLDKPLGGTTAQQGKPSIAGKFQKPTQSKQQEEAGAQNNEANKSIEDKIAAIRQRQNALQEYIKARPVEELDY